MKHATNHIQQRCASFDKNRAKQKKMKFYLKLLLLSITLLAISCKENATKQKTDKTEKQIEIKKKKKLLQDSVIAQNKIQKPKYYIHKFVNAKSGLNYRDSPNGIILDKFPLNTRLKILENTEIFDQIEDEGKKIKGEWLGVDKDNDTVYVFSTFLSDFYNYSDIGLFYASPYNKSYDKTSQGFVNLSEIYPLDFNENKSTIIPENDLGKDPVKFNKTQRKKIFKTMEISNRDTLYIFNFDKDSIFKYPTSNLTAIAYVNPYSKGDRNLTEDEYMIGLNLEDKFTTKGQNFAYIGKTNPFQTGKIKPLIWNRTDNLNFPLKETIIDKQTTTDNITLETYTLSISKFKYFIQSHISNKNNRSRVQKHQLVVIDTTTNKITTELNYNSSESINISPVYKSSYDKMEHYYSWTGELFKNKPPMIYGLYGNSFGCSTVDFIYKNEPSIRIFCDNRH